MVTPFQGIGGTSLQGSVTYVLRICVTDVLRRFCYLCPGVVHESVLPKHPCQVADQISLLTMRGDKISDECDDKCPQRQCQGEAQYEEPCEGGYICRLSEIGCRRANYQKERDDQDQETVPKASDGRESESGYYSCGIL